MCDVSTWIEAHPGIAAWIQAIGAILALLIAIFIPAWQAKRAESANRRQFLESVASIGEEVQECFDNAARECGHDLAQGTRFVLSLNAHHRFRIAFAAVNAIPIHQLPGYGPTRAVLELQRLMVDGKLQLDTALEEIQDKDTLVQSARYGRKFADLAEQARCCLLKIKEGISETNKKM